jgi:tripartite-type tricarboxylate transporter receptor subunit TctC
MRLISVLKRLSAPAWLALAVVAATSPAALAQFGSQPVKIIFPFAAGGSGDAVARMLAERISLATNQSAFVENRTGGSGMLGVQAVKSAPADGTTLLLTPFTLMVIYPHIYPDLKYDPQKDFVPISQVCSFEFAIAVAKNSSVKTIREMVEWIRKDPKAGSYGTPGAGTLPHFFGIAFGRAAGLDYRHVAYRGASAAVADLVAGQIPTAVLSTADVLEHHNQGTVRILATLDASPSPFISGIPTLKESGYDLSGNGWFALYAPAGTPPAIVERINAIVREYAQSKPFGEKLLTLGLLATGTSGEELASRQRMEARTWEPIIKTSGFKPTD